MTGLFTIFCLFIAGPPCAEAGEGEFWLGGGIIASSIPTENPGVAGVGGSVHFRYGLIDQLTLDIGAVYSFHPSVPPVDEEEGEPTDLHVLIPKIGLLLPFDTTTTVPYLFLDVTAYLADPTFFRENSAAAAVGFGTMIGFGFEYQGWSHVGLAAEVAYHAFITDFAAYPVYIHLSIAASYRWGEP